MVNRALLTQKLAELADRVSRISEFIQSSTSRLRDNRNAFELVSFNLMLAVQVCVDIASHIVSDESWIPARSLGESFARLEEHGVIDTELATSMRKAVGLRNIVAHGYSGIDYDMVELAATTGAKDLSRFAQAVAAWAQRTM